MADIQIIIITAICVIIIASFAAILLTRRLAERAQRAISLIIPQAMLTDGVDIPIIRAFTGIKGLGALAIAQNSIKPQLRFFENRVDYRVFFPKSAAYGEIERVAGYCRRFFNNMRFEFRGRSRTFTAYLVNEQEYRALENFLRGKGVPVETRD